MKDRLSKISILYKLNAKIKCILTKIRYKKNQFKYSKTRTYNTIKQRFDVSWKKTVNNKEKPIIYFIGTDESQDKSGLIPDLSEIVKLHVFHRYNGEYGQYSGLVSYNGIKGRKLNTDKVISDITELIQAGNKPDIVLMQAWGRSFEIKRLIDFKSKYDMKFVNISLDDRLVFKVNTPRGEKYNFGISGLIPIVDLFLVSNPEIVNWYHALKANAIYFPMASSKKVFFPMDIEKRYDVGFIGNKYGYRGELIEFLQKNGLKIKAYGRGWENGFLDSSQANKFYNECKVVLGIGTIGHCSNFYTQKLRDFDVPLSSSVYITNKNTDLLELYQNNEIVLADSKKDFLRKIELLLNDEELRNAISSKAYSTASELHTYTIRFRNLFNMLGIKLW